jgi:hypothetical protein
MRRRAPQFLAWLVALLLLSDTTGSGQVTALPTPEPLVTAENETWYLAGEPIQYAGSVYYPTGPMLYFNPSEMVRSGDYLGIPLYSRTTLEPFSIVYVPLAGRLMRPYERRRSGDMAGTVGSTMPSFPVTSPYDPLRERGMLEGVVAAPAPPTLVASAMGTDPGVAVGAPPGAPPQAEPTTGSVSPGYPWGPLASARKPEGLNGMFVEYRDRRWFNSGSAVQLDAARYARIDDYRGFPVYRLAADEETIYVAVTKEGNLFAPYSTRR